MIELIIAKSFTVIFIVLALVYIAENISVRISGIIVGLPMASFMTYVFFGIEFGTKYVQEITLYNINGLLPNLLFCSGYYVSTFYQGKYKVLVSLSVSLSVYFIAMLAISTVIPNIHTTPFIVLPIIILAVLYFESSKDHHIEKPLKLSLLNFIARLALTVFIFLIISTLPYFVSQNFAGILSSFPIILLPLVIIIHFNYGSYQARTIVKNAPMGLTSVTAYSLVVYFTIDFLGIFFGISLALFTSFIVVFLQIKFLTFYKQVLSERG